MPPQTPENTADDAAAAPRKRRRRVVRDVVTPAEPPAADESAPATGAVAPEPTTTDAPADAPASSADQPVAAEPTAAAEPAPAAEAPAAAPTRARRSRRVTRTVVIGDAAPAAASAPTAPASDAAATPDEVTPGTAGEDEAEEGAPDEAVASQAPDDAAEAIAGPETTDEPGATDEPTGKDAAAPEETAPAPRRRRASRRKSAAPDATADGGAAPETPASETPAPAEAPLDVLAELGPVRTGDEPPARARLATTALLFQAPEPTARTRRRRAQAATGAPEEISGARKAEEDAAADAPADAPEAPAADEAPRDESAPRGRRRRGGRGRRSAEAPETREATESDEGGPGEAGADLAPAGADDASPAQDVEDAATDTAGTDDEQGAGDEQGADDDAGTPRRRRRRGGRGRRGRSDAPEGEENDDTEGDAAAEPEATSDAETSDEASDDESGGSSRRRRRRRRGTRGEAGEEPRRRSSGDEVTALRGSTRLEAKRQRRREGRDAGRRRQIITEAEFLARRESVERTMVVRELDGRTQIAVLEDGVLVEHYVSNQAQASMVGNVYLGRVQNVLPSMEAAFVDVGKGRNAVLYAGEVNWDAVGLEGQPRRIEQALKSGDSVLVQVTKDPIGHKGARLTSQITLAGRYLVYVPGGGMTGISRKLPDTERSRLKKILRDLVPDSAGVIVRTAAEGASEDELRADVARLQGQWEAIEKKRKSANAPALLQGEPDMAIRVVRDIFNDDFSSLVVQGDQTWSTISGYVADLAPDLAARVEKWTGTQDVFTVHRVDEQLAKGMDRKVWLPSGGSLVIDRTEAMTVVDVNTGKFTGAGGTLEETVTRNNLEAAEEIVRQLRLRDIGGIIVIDFIDMVLESNRDLVLRRLVECLGRDRTKHQVAEVTSLGLVQMTRKRVGQGLVEAFSETCEHCHGRGFIVHTDPVPKGGRTEPQGGQEQGESKRARRKRAAAEAAAAPHPGVPVLPEAREAVKATLATIAAAAAHAHDHDEPHDHEADAHEAHAHDTHDAPAAGEADVAQPEQAAPTAQDVTPEGDTTGRGDAAPTLDVLAELSAAGVGAAAGRTAVETDAPLSLHAVAPEVFEDADAPTADDTSDDDAPRGG